MAISYRAVRSMGDRKVVLNLYQGASEYSRLIGDPYPSRATVEHDRTARPESVAAEQKHFGILALDGADIGVLDLVDGYPDAQTVYIGLLLFPSRLQRHGYGRRVLGGLKQHFAAQGRQRLRVAVVTDDKPALTFWQQVGFQPVGQSSAAVNPRTVRPVIIMDLALK